MRKAALELLLTRPAQVARLCGLDRLTDELHGRWMQEMLTGREDMTLLAHRGSYKTTCLAFAMAAMLLAFPKRNILFMRKTDEDVVEVLRDAGADVLGVVSIFTYGMQRGIERLAAANVKNISLTNFEVIAEVAAEEGYIQPEDIQRLIAFRNNPSDESWIGAGK